MHQRLVNTLQISLLAIFASCSCSSYTVELQLDRSSMNGVFPIEIMLLRDYEVPILGFASSEAANENQKDQITAWFQSRGEKLKNFQNELLEEGRMIRIANVSLPHMDSGETKSLQRSLDKGSGDPPVVIIVVALFNPETEVNDHFAVVRVDDNCRYSLVVSENLITKGSIKE